MIRNILVAVVVSAAFLVAGCASTTAAHHKPVTHKVRHAPKYAK